MPQTKQTALAVDVIKQYPGPQQVKRAVKVKVPGKHFPGLQPAEQKVEYEATAVDYAERHKFTQHLKAWGAAHTGPGIRFTCVSDAIDDPDHKGFWTTLTLWNRWRHETYKESREAEKQFLDELPTAAPTTAVATAAAKADKSKDEPEIKKHFIVTSTGTHVYGGTGTMAGKSKPCFFYACKIEGCPRGRGHPIKQVGGNTGQLFTHLETCQPALCKELRSKSAYSPVQVGEDGEEYSLYSFDELLPHHARYVEKCFRGFDHFYETRADNGLLEYVQGFDKHANLPHEQTCQQLLEVFEELFDQQIAAIIATLEKTYGGGHFCGSTADLWSLKSCRQSFGCYRGSFIVDGDLLAKLTDDPEHKGKLLEFSPILGFNIFDETRHTGAAIARWKQGVQKHWKLQGATGLATEDGASNNVTANRIMGQDMKVCLPHDVSRAVLYSVGEAGKPSQNPDLKQLITRSSKQSAAFNRSVVANVSLQQAQLEANPDMKPHQTLTTKTKNLTRWMGLWEMANRNRRVGPEIRIALTGNASGVCAEVPAMPVLPPMRVAGSDSEEDDEDSSEDNDQEEGNRAANKKHPLAHRCISTRDFRSNEILESVLDRPRETTLLSQDGAGLDLGMGYVLLGTMRDEAKADRVEVSMHPPLSCMHAPAPLVHACTHLMLSHTLTSPV